MAVHSSAMASPDSGNSMFVNIINSAINCTTKATRPMKDSVNTSMQLDQASSAEFPRANNSKLKAHLTKPAISSLFLNYICSMYNTLDLLRLRRCLLGDDKLLCPSLK